MLNGSKNFFQHLLSLSRQNPLYKTIFNVAFKRVKLTQSSLSHEVLTTPHLLGKYKEIMLFFKDWENLRKELCGLITKPSTRFQYLNSTRSYTEEGVVKIFDFGAISNKINLEKSIQQENTHMWVKFMCLKHTWGRRGVKKILWYSILYWLLIISLYLE